MRHLFSFFLLFYLFPSAYWDRWIGCCGSTCPRLLSGTNFKKLGWKKDGRENMLGRERERERILSHYGASSIIQMAAVPLHLFSLLGLNIKMAATKETDIQKMKPTQRAKAECAWLFTSEQQQSMNGETIYATGFEEANIPVTYGLNSIKDRLRDCFISIKNMLPVSQQIWNASSSLECTVKE